MPSPEQDAAQLALQAAVEQHMIAFRSPTSNDVEVTGDWLLVSCVMTLDLVDSQRRYAYNLAFSGGEMPEHIAHGLLQTARLLLEEGKADG